MHTPISCSVPQCAVSDVEFLVKSLFWESKSSPNEFFDFDPSSPPPPPHTYVPPGGGGGCWTIAAAVY